MGHFLVFFIHVYYFLFSIFFLGLHSFCCWTDAILYIIQSAFWEIVKCAATRIAYEMRTRKKH